MKGKIYGVALIGILVSGCSTNDEEREEVGRIVWQEEDETEWHTVQEQNLAEGSQEALLLEREESSR
ncbi:MAG: hypothetical protein FJZ58_01120 [Chlamydiae bacterium]|nr:hypothetical protein [Chlamydiota bacterium]